MQFQCFQWNFLKLPVIWRFSCIFLDFIPHLMKVMEIVDILFVQTFTKCEMIFPYNFISGFLLWTIAGYFSLSICKRVQKNGPLRLLWEKNRSLRQKNRSLREKRGFPKIQVMTVIFQVVRSAMTIELIYATDRNRKVQVMKQKSVEIKVCTIIFIIKIHLKILYYNSEGIPSKTIKFEVLKGWSNTFENFLFHEKSLRITFTVRNFVPGGEISKWRNFKLPQRWGHFLVFPTSTDRVSMMNAEIINKNMFSKYLIPSHLKWLSARFLIVFEI